MLQVDGYRHGLLPSTPVATSWGAATTSPGHLPTFMPRLLSPAAAEDKVYMYKTLQCPFYLHPFIRIYCNTKKILNLSPPLACLQTFLPVWTQVVGCARVGRASGRLKQAPTGSMSASVHFLECSKPFEVMWIA